MPAEPSSKPSTAARWIDTLAARAGVRRRDGEGLTLPG
jgi:hypothetical protein